MNRFVRFLFILCLRLLSAYGQDANHTVTGGFNGADYEYLIHPHLALEAGAITTGPAFDFSAPYRTAVPFGFRGILPLHGQRVELYLGGGGAYLHQLRTNALGPQASGGARFALDKRSRFWLGSTVHYVHVFQPDLTVGILTFDFGYRFQL